MAGQQFKHFSHVKGAVVVIEKGQNVNIHFIILNNSKSKNIGKDIEGPEQGSLESGICFI